MSTDRENANFIIAAWANELPGRLPSKTDRIGDLVNLVNALKSAGYEKDDFSEYSSVYKLIMKTIVNPNAHISQRNLKIWYDMAEKDLFAAVAEVYEIVAEKYQPSQELIDKKKQLEEKFEQERIANEAKKKQLEEKAEQEKIADDIRKKQAELELPPPCSNPLDRSIFKDEPDFEVVYDDNFEEN